MNSPEKPSSNYEELRVVFSSLIEKIELGFFDPIMADFYNEIQRKYSYEEYGHCLLWHLIIGSTPDQTDINFDTPGGEIEDFIRNRLPSFIQKNSGI
jgi:hypothetical protein